MTDDENDLIEWLRKRAGIEAQIAHNYQACGNGMHSLKRANAARYTKAANLLTQLLRDAPFDQPKAKRRIVNGKRLVMVGGAWYPDDSGQPLPTTHEGDA